MPVTHEELMRELLRDPTPEEYASQLCMCGNLVLFGKPECLSCEMHRLFPEVYRKDA